MKDTRAYWAIRLTLGIGLWLAIFVGLVVAAGGPSAVMEDIEEEGINPVAVLVGAVFGSLWENVIAAGVAAYAVYGKFIPFTPPMYVSPRDRFEDTSFSLRY